MRITPGARLASAVSIELIVPLPMLLVTMKAVSDVGNLEFRSVFRLARHFRDAVHAAHFFSDVSCHSFPSYLRRAARHRPLQSENDGAFSEFDFVTVVLKRFRILQSRFGSRFKRFIRRRLSDQHFFRFG